MSLKSRTYLDWDVMDMVADHLLNDKSSLASLSLANQSWLVPAQRRLFHTIEIVVDKTAVPPEEFVPEIWKDPSPPLRGFLSFINTRAQISSYVRTLTLASEFRQRAASLDPDSDCVLLLKKLTSLHTLAFHHIDFIASHKFNEPPPYLPSPRSKHLVLYQTVLIGGALGALLRLFPPRDSLSMDSSIDESDGPSPEPHFVVPSVALRLGDVGRLAMFLPNLSLLCLNMEWGDEIEEIFGEPSFFAENGRELRHLRIALERMQSSFLNRDIPTDILRLIPSWAEVCPCLQTLCLTIETYSSGPTLLLTPGTVQITGEILSSLSHTTTKVTLGLCIFSEEASAYSLSNSDSGGEGDWQVLSRIIGRHAHLTSVRVAGVGHVIPQWAQHAVLRDEDCVPLERIFQEFIKSEFQELSTLGVLEFL